MTTRSTLGDKAPLFRWPSQLLRLIVDYGKCYFLNHPTAWRLFFAALRKWRPIAFVGNLVFVANARDVCEVLDRMEDFTIADALAPNMPWGPFMLGIDCPEQHKKERYFLKSVVLSTDVEAVRCSAATTDRQVLTKDGESDSGPSTINVIADLCEPVVVDMMVSTDAEAVRCRAATKCREVLTKNGESGSGPSTINVVADLCEPVVVDMIQSYFGVPDMGKKNPKGKNMAAILGDVASFFLLIPPRGSQPWLEAIESIASLTKAVDERIKCQRDWVKAHSKTDPRPYDLLTRLLVEESKDGSPRTFLNEDWIRRYITGLAVFGGGTITRATTHAIDQLLRNSEHLDSARKIADQIEKNVLEQPDLKSKRDSLRQIIYEALRFRPMLPLLVRYTPRDTLIAKGFSHARLVPGGKTVIAAPIAAMFDPKEFHEPALFKCNRSLNKYVHYGPDGGRRRCFGEYVADVLIVEIISALLVHCKKLTRAHGSKGEINYYLHGPAPQSLFVTLT
jgi:cytochrome P450